MLTAHIIELPPFVPIIRIAQLILSIVIIGLAGNTLNGFNGGTGFTLGLEPLAFMIFCCVWTLVINAYLLATLILIPAAYNMWVHLAVEAIAWIFWLSAWAATASWASTWSFYSDYSGKVYSYWATAAAAAAMGTIMWVMYTVTLAFFCLKLYKQRFGSDANAHMGGIEAAEKGGESHPMGAVQQQQVVYPPSDSAPTPVQYAASPPPQQWQQSPQPQQQY
ncbi:hypothetical protein BGX38DRAFT_1141216 [Terfezia claveryi]|nr:hypothetical protein BGX38DRAFT_1141216 [Terfezia claveryi]